MPVRAKARLPEGFRCSPDAENKNSLSQMLGNLVLAAVNLDRSGLRKMHLRPFTRVDGLAVDRELLFEHAKFFESFRKLESDTVAIGFCSQVDLDLKSHRHVRPSASEILRFH